MNAHEAAQLAQDAKRRQRQELAEAIRPALERTEQAIREAACAALETVTVTDLPQDPAQRLELKRVLDGRGFHVRVDGAAFVIGWARPTLRQPDSGQHLMELGPPQARAEAVRQTVGLAPIAGIPIDAQGHPV